MASTTSTQNSGLTDYLFPAFEKATGGKIRIELIAVGTGKALKLGERGDADLVFVHAPELEEEFVRKGFGVNRRPVMHNDFVILGPPSDPASIKGKGPAIEAFRDIAEQKSLFVSRGDNSGTHIKELSIWEKAGVDPRGMEGYIETGSGMAATLRVADEKEAYTLSDRGTYLNYRSRIELVILYQSDPVLHNPYGIMAVNPERFPHVHYKEAMRFIEWITSSEGQRLIGLYKKNGGQLFFPDAQQP
jgi:tungstate transport system substrate-binding protein